jgi:hypothetical protein
MANTYIVSGSQFKPYTFDEMIKPALMYKQAYEDTEKKLESLEELGIDENSFLEQDAASKELYNNYMTKLQETSDALSNGYNAEIAKQARDLHRTFKTKINPMKTKLAIRAALTEEQRRLIASNPYLEFDKDYSTTSLDDITETSTYKTRDLSKISAEIAADMTKFVASMTPEFIEGTISGVGNTLTTKYGYTPKDAYTQIKTEGTELNEKFKKYYDKYKNASFKDDKLINTIENTMISNAGVSDTQFVKGGNNGLIVREDGSVFSENGIYQGKIDENGVFKKHTGDTTTPPSSMFNGIDENIYIISTDGKMTLQPVKDNKNISNYSIINDFKNLPLEIQNLVKQYQEGSISVRKKSVLGTQGFYMLTPNYNNTGIRWSEVTTNGEELPSSSDITV